MQDLSQFNASGVSYSENPDKITNANGADVISLCKDFHLVPVNHRETESVKCQGKLTYRQGNRWVSQLDWALVSERIADAVTSFRILQDGFRQSDHAPFELFLKPLEVDLSTLHDHACSLGQYDTKQPSMSKRPIKYGNVDRERFLTTLHNSPVAHDDDPVELAKCMANTIYSACRTARATQNQPRSSNENVNRWIWIQNTRDSRELWKSVGWNGKFTNGNSPDSPSDEDFRSHFNDLLNPPSDPLVIPAPSPYIPILDDDITLYEVDQEVKRLKANKAAGIDGIPPGVLKFLPADWLVLLTILFNKLFANGMYPSQWAIAKLFVIFKKRQLYGPSELQRNQRNFMFCQTLRCSAESEAVHLIQARH